MARPRQHTIYGLNVSFRDKTTPFLKRLWRALDDRTELNAAIARRAAVETRRHIREAASVRHETANALGATPTNYLTRRARDVQGTSDKRGAKVIVKGAIFARVNGPVTIRPVRSKYLTIPIDKDSHGKRARDFEDLIFRRSKKTGASFLARKVGRRLQPLFLLLKKVVLPQDVGLLPGDKDYASWSEQTAREYLDALDS
jgi:hypothetical protein